MLGRKDEELSPEELEAQEFARRLMSSVDSAPERRWVHPEQEALIDEIVSIFSESCAEDECFSVTKDYDYKGGVCRIQVTSEGQDFSRQKAVGKVLLERLTLVCQYCTALSFTARMDGVLYTDVNVPLWGE